MSFDHVVIRTVQGAYVSTSRAIYRRLLHATYTSDKEAMAYATAELEGQEVTWADSGLLAASVFTLAIRDWFAEGVDEHEVVALAEAVAERSDQEQKMLETVIWSALGRDDLVDEVGPMHRMRAHVAVVKEIVQKVDGTEEDVSGLLDQAEEMLDSL